MTYPIIVAILIVLLIAAAVKVTISTLALRGCREELAKTERCYKMAVEAQHRAETAAEAGRSEAITAQARLESALQRIADMQRQYAADEERFKRLSAQALQMQSGQFAARSESRLAELLAPLRDDIERFKVQVDRCYNDEARERHSLRDTIMLLMDQSQSIGREARELVKALRGNSKTQGDWGEMILQRLLEKSGLREGQEFVVQQTRDADGNPIKDDEGNQLRPDVVVYLPENRAIVIDSKVSLTAFTNWANAEGDESKAVRDAAGKLHVKSVRDHIDELYRKSYQDRIGGRSLDFVMMFIPNEAAYMAAMSIEPNLWQEAYDKRVLIVSPTHLVSVLKLTAQLWDHEKQTKNALNIAKQAGAMYDKFVGFVADMKRIEGAIGQTQKAWSDAMNKLSSGTGNLVKRAEDLRKLHIKAAKRLPSELCEPEPYSEPDGGGYSLPEPD